MAWAQMASLWSDVAASRLPQTTHCRQSTLHLALGGQFLVDGTYQMHQYLGIRGNGRCNLGDGRPGPGPVDLESRPFRSRGRLAQLPQAISGTLQCFALKLTRFGTATSADATVAHADGQFETPELKNY